MAEPSAVLGLYHRNVRPSDATLSDEYLTRAAEMAPNNATIHLWQGTSRMILGHLERAHESLLVARELDPGVPSVGSRNYVDLGFGYRFSDYINARFNISNLLETNPPMMADNAANNTDTGLYDIFGRSYTLSISLQY